MIKPILIALIVIIVIRLGMSLYWYRIAVAHMRAHTANYEQIGDSNGPKALFIGDSTAAGLGAVPIERSVAGYFGASFPKAHITNLGISGMRVAGLRARLEAMPPDDYDVVVVHISGNDVVRFTSWDEFARDVEAIHNEAKKLGKAVIHIPTGLVGDSRLFPLPLSWLYNYRTLKARKIMIEIAQRTNTPFADILGLDKEGVIDYHGQKVFSFDRFHPGNYGYSQWNKAIIETMSRNNIVL